VDSGFCLALSSSNSDDLSSNCSDYTTKIRRDFPNQQTAGSFALKEEVNLDFRGYIKSICGIMHHKKPRKLIRPIFARASYHPMGRICKIPAYGPEALRVRENVTLHGIGFQQPPQPPDIPGYADDLHQNLSQYLGTMLGDDPRRERQNGQPGTNGPVYVQSWYPPGQQHAKSGLSRLGNWTGPEHRDIDASNAPLVDNNQRVAHVALVYSQLEGQGPLIGSSLVTGEMVSVSVFHYAHVAGLIQMLFTDLSAMLQHQPKPAENMRQSASLRIRSDPGFKAVKHYQNDHTPTGLLAVLRQLENDVAAHVVRNEQPEQVRYFVHDALLRLASRKDVEGIVINSHSNRTVIGLDVVRELPPFAAEKIKAFVTAGSPLRKYIDLFVWGQQIDSINPIQKWVNFWDPLDPVADPLAPPATWRRGDDLVPPFDPSLFQLINPNTGETTSIDIKDCKVDNITNSKDTELKAHNYWDNDKEFVKPLADILKAAAGNSASLNIPANAA
jgi:hypothetical protein